MVKPNVDKQLQYVLARTHAYDNIYDEPKHLKHPKTKQRLVKEMLQNWAIQRCDRSTWQLGQSWKLLLRPKGNLANESAAIVKELYPSTFKFHPSYDDQHTELRDAHGVIIAYRLQLPAVHIKHLQESEHILPPVKFIKDKRGHFRGRHYAVWMNYDKSCVPAYSREYLDDLPAADDWLQHNAMLFRYLSNRLRCHGAITE